MPKLGVNIDHVATVRQARRASEPDPVWAAAMAQLGGADQITVHLREDRRHIQDRDVRLLRETVTVRLNLECACEESMLRIAGELKPDQVCLVPERREEVTTEGGLDVFANADRVRRAVAQLLDCGIAVSLFIDPISRQIEASVKSGAPAVELHTGKYALAVRTPRELAELNVIQNGVAVGLKSGLLVDAGHGLTYTNVVPIASIPGIRELNIGHSIISRSIFVGLTQAVREMKALVSQAGC